MERPTQQLTTKSGINIIMYTYLTAREFSGIMDNREDKSDITVGTELAKASLVSINGDTDKEKLLDIPLPDYVEFSKAVQKISGKDFTTAE